MSSKLRCLEEGCTSNLLSSRKAFIRHYRSVHQPPSQWPFACPIAACQWYGWVASDYHKHSLRTFHKKYLNNTEGVVDAVVQNPRHVPVPDSKGKTLLAIEVAPPKPLVRPMEVNVRGTKRPATEDVTPLKKTPTHTITLDTPVQDEKEEPIPSNSESIPAPAPDKKEEYVPSNAAPKSITTLETVTLRELPTLKVPQSPGSVLAYSISSSEPDSPVYRPKIIPKSLNHSTQTPVKLNSTNSSTQTNPSPSTSTPPTEMQKTRPDLTYHFSDLKKTLKNEIGQLGSNNLSKRLRLADTIDQFSNMLAPTHGHGPTFDISCAKCKMIEQDMLFAISLPDS